MAKTNRFFLLLALGALSFGGAVGCGSKETASSSDGLRSVQVPADFTFATSRSVGVKLSVSRDLVGDGVAATEVSTIDGKVLFRGSVSAASPLELKLAVPTKDTQLAATLFVNNEPKKATIDIKDGTASQLFQ